MKTSLDFGMRVMHRLSWIMAAYLVLATSVAAGADHILRGSSHASNLAEMKLPTFGASTPSYLVLIVLDGARPDYFGLTRLPHVDALRSSGTQFTHAIDGILEAETPAGHATIATGSRPNRTGILGFDWATDSGRTSIFSPDQMANLETMLQDSHAPTIAGLYKQRFPSAKVVALSGHKYYAAAPLGGPSADAIMYYQGDSKGRYVPVAVPGHMPPAGVLSAPGVISPTTHLPDGGEDHLATTLALATVSNMHPRILLINYPEFDWPLGHVDGGILNPRKVITDMQAFDTDLGRIEARYRKERILSKTLFVITADHGMMPVTHFVPSKVITSAITRAGTTAPDIAANSSDFIWLANPSKALTVAVNIDDEHAEGIQSIYYLDSSNGSPHYVLSVAGQVSATTQTANEFLLQALLNGHEPTVVVFGREGVTFTDPKTGWKADHGGNTWQSQHIPLILAGPGVRRGVVNNAPVQLEDIAPTALYDMGVAPVGMDGHALTGALQHAQAAPLRARSVEVAQIGPVVSALKKQEG